MKKRNILNRFLYIIIILLSILICYLCFQDIILKKDTISILNSNCFIILSGSMEPTIKTKDFIITHKKNNYELNDIIAFKNRNSNSTIVHRIVKIEYTKNGLPIYTTKGDNNNVEDSKKISKEEIIGKYYITIPLLGMIILFIKANPILDIIIIIVGILIYYIIKLINK